MLLEGRQDRDGATRTLVGHWGTGTLPTRQLAYRGHVTISASTGTDAGTGGIDSAYRGTHASDFCPSASPLFLSPVALFVGKLLSEYTHRCTSGTQVFGSALCKQFVCHVCIGILMNLMIFRWQDASSSLSKPCSVGPSTRLAPRQLISHCHL